MALLLIGGRRDGHGLPLRHARPGRGRARGRHRGRRIGRPEVVTRRLDQAGRVVIDVGINRASRRQAVRRRGLRRRAAEVAAAITPVPGGVGPMTIAMLLSEQPASGAPPRRRLAGNSSAGHSCGPRGRGADLASGVPRRYRTALGFAITDHALCSSTKSGIAQRFVGAALVRANAIALELAERDDRRRRGARVELQRLDRARALGPRRVEVDDREIIFSGRQLGPRAEVVVDDLAGETQRR